jgi:hypothetical protein
MRESAAAAVGTRPLLDRDGMDMTVMVGAHDHDEERQAFARFADHRSI